MGYNLYYSGGWKYATSNSGSLIQQDYVHNGFTIAVAPAGTAGNPATIKNALFIAGSGNVGVGTTSPGAPLQIGPDFTLSGAWPTMGYNLYYSGGWELRPLAWAQAWMGDEAAALRTFQQFNSARHLPPAENEKQQALLRAFAALSRGDGAAAVQAWAPLSWPYAPTFRALAYVVVRDYANAERWLKLVIMRHHWISDDIAIVGRSPLEEDLCHYYLGQVYEATNRRDEAIREYRAFLARYTHSHPRLPEIAQARAALKRLGA